jgi:hypothetical protein
MRIKIANKWYTIEDRPLMVELTYEDKRNITNMDPEATKYCVWDTDLHASIEIEKWMHDEGKVVKYKPTMGGLGPLLT